MTHPRLESLLKKISQIELLLEVEQNRPSPDPVRLQILKREKLKLRDEIHLIRNASLMAA
ncbi:MAG: YdcH family protein [Alphaproteobacteria bacterium]